MRKAGQVHCKRLARNVFTKEQWNFLFPYLCAAFFDDFSHSNNLSLFVWHFDPDAILARNRSHDSDAWNSQGNCQVICKASDLAESEPCIQFDFVKRDNRAGFDFHHPDIETEVCKRLLEYLRFLFHFLRLLVVGDFVGFCQEIESRQNILLATLGQFRVVEQSKRVLR